MSDVVLTNDYIIVYHFNKHSQNMFRVVHVGNFDDAMLSKFGIEMTSEIENGDDVYIPEKDHDKFVLLSDTEYKYDSRRYLFYLIKRSKVAFVKKMKKVKK
jgi:hypothetical protein